MNTSLNLIFRRKAEVFCSIKDIILRNIQEIEMNFLIMQDEQDIYSNSMDQQTTGFQMNLETELKKRIENEILKTDYYHDQIAKFEEWSETVLVGVDSIMGTMGGSSLKGQINFIGNKPNHKKLYSTFKSRDIDDNYFQAGSSNLEESVDNKGYPSNQVKGNSKRYSGLLRYNKEPNSLVQVSIC